MDNIEILDEKVVYQNGSFMRVQHWLRGVHPKLGIIVQGLTGWETLVEEDVIKPLHTFYVHEKEQVVNEPDTIQLNQATPSVLEQAG